MLIFQITAKCILIKFSFLIVITKKLRSFWLQSELVTDFPSYAYYILQYYLPCLGFLLLFRMLGVFKNNLSIHNFFLFLFFCYIFWSIKFFFVLKEIFSWILYEDTFLLFYIYPFKCKASKQQLNRINFLSISFSLGWCCW